MQTVVFVPDPTDHRSSLSGWGQNNLGDVSGAFYIATAGEIFAYPNLEIWDLNDSRVFISSNIIHTGGVETPVNFPGAVQTYLYGINNKNHVVGWYHNDTEWTNTPAYKGFVFDGVGFQTISFPGSWRTETCDINDSGSVVGWYHIGTERRAFLYEKGVYTDISPPTSFSWAAATGINNLGIVLDSRSKRQRFQSLNGKFR